MSIKDAPKTWEYLQELFQRSSRIVFAYHVESRTFSYLNPAFEKIWNLSPDQASASPASLLEAVHPEDKAFLKSCYGEILAGKEKEKIEFRLMLDKGDFKWLCLSHPLLIKDASGQHITGMVDDITAVREQYNVLEKFAAKKDSVLEILSHDLAGPLTNIKALSAILAEETKAYGNKDLEKLIESISRTSERSIQLIRDFVQQEFLESANFLSTKRRVDIVRKLQESMDQYRDSEKHISKHFIFTTSDEEIFMEVDDYKFMQVINNLLSNSLKFTRDGGTITVSIDDQGDTVLFKVADNGVGIPAKYHDELFEKFTHARRPGLRGEPSTGLGMSIIKTIVEWHQGNIWFESKENEGTTFFIELPKG